jgi:DNA adenine methylase
MSTPKLVPPLKWHGGKRYLAERIVALIPRHRYYVEPYAGGLAVLLERDPNDRRLWLSEKAGQDGVSEVVNDLNGELINFWRVLRHQDLFPEFARLCQATPLARSEFERAVESQAASADPVGRAWAFFVRCRQSRAGTFKGFTSITRSRTRRGVNGNASEWIGAVDGLPAVHARLRPVVIENMKALDLMRRDDGPGTLYYLDPPYLHETRQTTDAYAFEMTEADHRDLLDLVKQFRGQVMLSGYPSPLYDEALTGWNRHTFDLPNHAAGGMAKRRMTECLWCNF